MKIQFYLIQINNTLMQSILIIETQVLFTGIFPLPSNKSDQINRIYCKFICNNQETDYLITTKAIPDMSSALDITHLRYPNELEVIFGFGNLIKQLNPQIITGYNIHQFDFNYIRDRLLFWNDNDYSESNFTKAFDLTWVEEPRQSNALGFQTIKYYQYSNSKPVDLFQKSRIEYELKSYKLSDVLFDLLGLKVTYTNLRESNRIFSSEESGFEEQEKIIKEELVIMDNLKKLFQLVMTDTVKKIYESIKETN